MPSNIATYMLLYQVFFSYISVRFLRLMEISLLDVNTTDFFQILLKIERTAILLSKLSRS